MARLALSLFGPLQITASGAALGPPLYDKAQALLAYLAVEADRAHRRETLAEMFWPDQEGAVARHSLSQALWSVRQSINDPAASVPVLLATRQLIQFNLAADHWLDVAAFLDLVNACDRHAHRDLQTCQWCQSRLSEAADLYRGRFLEEFALGESAAFEEWAAIWREHCHQRMIWALDQLIAYHRRRGADDHAIRFARRAIALDPWREAAHRCLMQVLAGSGQRAAALAQYERCRQVLADELGVEPEAETTALYEEIRDGAVSAHRSAAPLPPPASARRELPIQPTPFIGRERELAWIADLLADPVCRLLTLIGPGGIGKTRLSLQVAADQLDHFADGACFVALAGLPSAALLVPAIADALGLPGAGSRDPKEYLLQALRQREQLLILDNAEHLLDGMGLVAEILERAPGVRVLATSRERLNLHGEWVIEVEGLEVPGEAGSAAIETTAAVRLFVQSAGRARADFTLQPSQHRAVARICQLVGGMPLGIELAAAWVPVLSCEEIAQEIELNLDFLAAAVRDLPERHRSMRAVFDRSWELLRAEEQRVFARLSVFRGGFTREAAERVAGASLPVLARLVATSLVRPLHSGRYDIHELLRQYAADRLSESEEAALETEAWHCDYFGELLAQRQAMLEGAEQAIALEEIGAEMENIRVAWQWAIEHRRYGTLARAARSLWLFTEVTGRYLEQRDAVEEALTMLERAADGAEADRDRLLTLGRLLSHHASYYIRLGTYERGIELADRSVDLLRSLDQPADFALALNFRAALAHVQQDYPREQDFLRESIALFAEAEDRWGQAYSLNDLAVATLLLGDAAEAQRLNEMSLAIFGEIGDRRGRAFALRNLGFIACQLGDLDQARRHLRASLEIRAAIGHRWGIADALGQLGILAVSDGAYDESLTCFRQALRELVDLQATAHALEVLVELGCLFLRLGRPEQSIAILDAVRGHPAAGPAVWQRAGQVLEDLPTAPSGTLSPEEAVGAIERQVQNILHEGDVVVCPA